MGSVSVVKHNGFKGSRVPVLQISLPLKGEWGIFRTNRSRRKVRVLKGLYCYTFRYGKPPSQGGVRVLDIVPSDMGTSHPPLPYPYIEIEGLMGFLPVEERKSKSLQNNYVL